MTETGAPLIQSAKKNIVLDATVFSTIMGCGRLVDLRFNHRLIPSGGKSNSLETGSIVHKGLEEYYKSLIKGFSKNQSVVSGMTAAELYISGCSHCTEYSGETKPTCGHAVNEYPGVMNTPPDSEGYKVGWKWVLQTLEEYFEFYKNDHWIPLFAEEVRGKILYEDDEIRILWKAKLDLGVDSNQGIFSVDHKTMKQNQDPISLNNQFMGQCHVMNTNEMVVNKIGFQKTLKPNEKFKRALIKYSSDRLLEWQSEILPYWTYQYLNWHETGYWAPNFDHCRTIYGPCIFRGVCESDRHMREEELRINFEVTEEWNPTNPTED